MCIPSVKLTPEKGFQPLVAPHNLFIGLLSKAFPRGSPSSHDHDCSFSNAKVLHTQQQERVTQRSDIIASGHNLNHGSNGNGNGNGTDNALPWMEKAWKTVSAAFLKQRSHKQPSVKRRFDGEALYDESLTGRRVRARSEIKETLFSKTWGPFESHLLSVLRNQLPITIISSTEMFCETSFDPLRNVCESNGLVLQTFSKCFFLQDYPMLCSRLAQNLTVDMKRPGSRKLSMLGFASVKGEPQLVGAVCSDYDFTSGSSTTGSCTSVDVDHGRKQSVPLPTVHFRGLMGLIPQLNGDQKAYPDKQKLHSVQDFFRYTESEGRRLFEELDRDKDGRVTLQDLQAAMVIRKLPSKYAHDFLRCTQSHWLIKSVGWDEFFSLVQEKEPMMIGLYNSLGVSKSGTLQRSHVKSLLLKAGLPATEENAMAMMTFLGADTQGYIKYGQFRRFMLLLPSEQLMSDPWTTWFKAATTIPASSGVFSAFATPPPRGIANYVKAVAFSRGIPYAEILSKFPRNGAKIAFDQQLTRQGTGIEAPEASKLLLSKIIPEISALQLFSSLCNSVRGVQIPTLFKDRYQTSYNGHKHQEDHSQADAVYQEVTV